MSEFGGVKIVLALGMLALIGSGGGCVNRAAALNGRLVHAGAQAEPAQTERQSLRERLRNRMQPAPTTSIASEQIELARRTATVWRPGQRGGRKSPLVIFSHGFHGSSRQSTFLMRALAEHGYLVVAPNHRDALGGGRGVSLRPDVPFEQPEAWSETTYRDRADDITAIVSALKKDAAWNDFIDWSRLALAGHSLGGYTVLGLAGAWPTWKLPGVKAVLALSPYCTPYLRPNRLSGLKSPVMYQGGTLDFGITPFVRAKGGAFDLTDGPAVFVEFDRAGHLAWTDLNLQCQANIVHYSLAFLDRYVKGDAASDPTRRIAGIAELRSK